MRLKRDLALTLLLQGGGGLATLLAALWIGRALGPGQQGQFNQLKSLVDLGAALAALGMPQALYVLAQQGRLALPRARLLARRVALGGLLVGALLVAWQHGLRAWPLAAAMACAVALATLQSQWRALVLLGPQTWRFNQVTIVPQLLLLPMAGAVVWAGGASALALAGALAGLWALACAQARQALARVPAPALQGAAVSTRRLLRHGGATWLAATAASGAIVLLQWQAQQVGGAAGLGRFALALLLVQLPLTPLNYALPLLLRHRLLRQGAALSQRLPWVLLPVLLLAGGVAWAGGWRSDLGMGAAYDGLHRVLAWLLLAGAAEAGIRLAAVDAQAEGHPLRTAWAEGLRVLLLGLGLWLGLADSLGSLAILWAAASGLALLVLVALGRQRRKLAQAEAATGASSGP